MVVLGLIVSVLMLAFPKIADRKSDIKKTVRHLKSLTGYLYDMSQLKNETYRLVLDLGKGANSNEIQSYWVERGNVRKIKELYEEVKEEEEESSDETKESKKPPQFIKDTQFLKKKRDLPQGLRMEFVEYSLRKEPVESGKAYIYFFPSGYTQETAFHLSYDKSSRWTLWLHPLTGKVTVFDQKKPLKEIRNR